MAEPTSIYVEDANGTVYIAEHAGCFDVPDRTTVAYEDEPIPAGARPLWTLTKVQPENSTTEGQQ